MSFSDYAYSDVTRLLEDNPGNSIALMIGVTKKDLRELPARYPLRAKPVYKASGEPLTLPEMGGASSLLKRSIQQMADDKKPTQIILGTPRQYLPAFFCLVADQICSGRPIEIAVNASNGQQFITTIDREYFQQFQDDINAGFRDFYERLFEKARRPEGAAPRSMEIFFFVKPLP